MTSLLGYVIEVMVIQQCRDTMLQLGTHLLGLLFWPIRLPDSWRTPMAILIFIGAMFGMLKDMV